MSCRLPLALLAVVAACGDERALGAPEASPDATRPAEVLLYSRTLGYRHTDAIAAAVPTLAARLAAAGVTSLATEDPAVLTAGLAGARAVVFLYTSGDDLLDSDGRAALEAFVRGGGGWVGLHSAADTEYGWPFYQQLVVAPFASHPTIQPATIDVEDRTHPAMAALPAGRWTQSDEWYDFGRQPRDVPGVRILATVDEMTYQGGMMGADHPIVWSHEHLGGRALYSALGHAGTRWEEPAFVTHVVEAVRWALRD
ncbi:MAG: ThuA domain-containing protein [Myxococcota bacterium]|nr:ThuA domain-containing protein [Myxococcota bacterium]